MNRMDPKLAATLRQPAELVERGLAKAADLADLERVAARYAIAVTPDIAGLIDTENPDDPIARQFIPSALELVSTSGENADPIGDDAHSPVTGIVHRYPDRVLFKLVHVCAVYCRFCFRREMVGPGKASALSEAAYREALQYIRERTEIWEVILTGGDPLMLSPRRLSEIMADLAAIDHVKIVRIHTRVPVAAPARIDEDMVEALRVDGATTWIAVHANHPRELSDAARAACARLADAGIPLVSQTVLLRGVNDDAAVLEALDAGLRRKPDQALLPASWRSGAGDGASAHHHRRGPGADAPPARPRLRPVPAGICAGYSRRPRKGADWPALFVAGKFAGI